MYIVHLKISGSRGMRSADVVLGRHAVLAGRNSGKTTMIEALALLFGRDRLVRRPTAHDFHAPDEAAHILCGAAVTRFASDYTHHHPTWFNPECSTEKLSIRKPRR